MWDERAGLTLANGSGRGFCATAAFCLVIWGNWRSGAVVKCHRNVRASRARIRSHSQGSDWSQSLPWRWRKDLLLWCSFAWNMPGLDMWYDIIALLPGWSFQGEKRASPTSHTQITHLSGALWNWTNFYTFGWLAMGPWVTRICYNRALGKVVACWTIVFRCLVLACLVFGFRMELIAWHVLCTRYCASLFRSPCAWIRTRYASWCLCSRSGMMIDVNNTGNGV